MTSKTQLKQDRIGMHAVLRCGGARCTSAAPIAAQTGGIRRCRVRRREQLVQEGFTFTEGARRHGGWRPLFLRHPGPAAFFHLDPAGKITVVRENTNGTTASRSRETVSCCSRKAAPAHQQARDAMAPFRRSRTASRAAFPVRRTISSSTRAADSISPTPVPAPGGARRPTHVFYLPAAPKSRSPSTPRVPRPNGLTITRDGRTLIVDDTLQPHRLRLRRASRRHGQEQRHLRAVAWISRQALKVGRRHGDRSRRPRLHHNRAGCSVRRCGPLLGTIKSARQGANVGIRRSGQAHALHHGARRSLSHQGRCTGTRPPGQVQARLAGPAVLPLSRASLTRIRRRPVDTQVATRVYTRAPAWVAAAAEF